MRGEERKGRRRRWERIGKKGGYIWELRNMERVKGGDTRIDQKKGGGGVERQGEK